MNISAAELPPVEVLAVAACTETGTSCEHILHGLNFKQLVGQHPLELVVLRLQLAKPLGFVHLQSAVLALPVVESTVRNTQLATDIVHLGSRFMLLQRPDNLFLGISLLHLEISIPLG